MDMNTQRPLRNLHDKAADRNGVGANVLWDGPLDDSGLPKGKGLSSGKDGIKLRFDDPSCTGGSIIQRVKAKQ